MKIEVYPLFTEQAKSHRYRLYMFTKTCTNCYRFGLNEPSSADRTSEDSLACWNQRVEIDHLIVRANKIIPLAMKKLLTDYVATFALSEITLTVRRFKFLVRIAISIDATSQVVATNIESIRMLSIKGPSGRNYFATGALLVLISYLLIGGNVSKVLCKHRASNSELDQQNDKLNDEDCTDEENANFGPPASRCADLIAAQVDQEQTLKCCATSEIQDDLTFCVRSIRRNLRVDKRGLLIGRRRRWLRWLRYIRRRRVCMRVLYGSLYGIVTWRSHECCKFVRYPERFPVCRNEEIKPSPSPSPGPKPSPKPSPSPGPKPDPDPEPDPDPDPNPEPKPKLTPPPAPASQPGPQPDPQPTPPPPPDY